MSVANNINFNLQLLAKIKLKKIKANTTIQNTLFT